MLTSWVFGRNVIIFLKVRYWREKLWGGAGECREKWAFPYLLQRILVAIQHGNTAAIKVLHVLRTLMTMSLVKLLS